MKSKSIIDITTLTATVSDKTQLLVAVSGGADSVAMLQALLLFDRYRLAVIHVNHHVRGDEADHDENFVRQLCKEKGLPFYCAHVRPETLRRIKTGSFEEALRTERHRLFEETASRLGAKYIAIGHTADDLVESYLMYLIRGTGPTGLRFHFMTTHNALTHIRPLWKTYRTQILEFCDAQHLSFVTDKTNADTRFTRNRIRHKLMPFLEEEFNPRVRQAIFAAATLTAEDANPATNVPIVTRRPLAIKQLLSYPDHKQTDVLCDWLREQTGRKVTYNHIETSLRLAKRRDNTFVSIRLSPDQHLTRLNGNLYVVELSRKTPTDRTQEQRLATALCRLSMAEQPDLVLAELAQPLPVAFADGEFSTSVIAADNTEYKLTLRFLPSSTVDIKALPPLYIRNRHAADRVATSSVRLNHLFNSDKVPAFLRNRVLVLADEQDRIFGISTFRRIQKRLQLATGLVVLWDFECAKQK